MPTAPAPIDPKVYESLTPSDTKDIYRAYDDGEMTPEAEQRYVGDVLAGRVKAHGPLRVPDDLWEAYRSGALTDEGRQRFEADMKSGVFHRPGMGKGVLSDVGELITGSERRLPETEALPGWRALPELNDPSLESAAAIAGTMFTGPEEAVKIIEKQFPGVKVRQDAAGTFILKSGMDGKEYAIHPGARWSDAISAVGNVAAFSPAGRATTLIGGAARSMLTEGAIQTSQEATGGDFGMTDVALAGFSDLAIRLAGQTVRGIVGAAGEAGLSDEQLKSRIGTLVRLAASGNSKAKEDLAALTNANKDLADAAERLGIVAPADTLIQSREVKQGIGLARAGGGPEVKAMFDDSISAVQKDAEAIMARHGGLPGGGDASTKIRQKLQAREAKLEDDAKKAFAGPDSLIANATPIDAPRTLTALKEMERDLGGRSGMKPELRNLLERMEAKQPITYGWLIAKRRDMGASTGRGTGNAFADIDTATADRFYAAMIEDQKDILRRVGGDDAVAALDEANRVSQLYKQMQTDIANTFGKDMQGSIADTLRVGAAGLEKGNDARLRRLVAMLPNQSLRKEAIMTGIRTAVEGGKADTRGFSFDKYVQWYKGFRDNQGIYREVSHVIGPQATRDMQDLFIVSRGVSEAMKNIPTTGLGLKGDPMFDQVIARSVLGQIFDAIGAIPGATFMRGNIAGTGVGSRLSLRLQPDRREGYVKLAKVFTDPEFFGYVAAAAKDPAKAKEATDKLMRTKAWQRFSEDFFTPESRTQAEQWLLSLAQTARTKFAPPEPGNAPGVP